MYSCTPRDSKPLARAMEQKHFILVTFPSQGQINPSLQFSKRLISTGARVTFVTTISAYRRMSNTSVVTDNFTFAPFYDGYDEGFNATEVDQYMSEFKRRGSEALTDLVVHLAGEGSPVTCIIYTTLLPWAGNVARKLNLPSALLWIQPATVLNIYYYYYNGYGDLFYKKNDPIELPGLPVLAYRDIPSYLLPSYPYAFSLETLKEQFEIFEQETKPLVLVNTFDALETEGLKAVDKLNLVAIGPLIPSAYLDGKDPSDKSFRADLFKDSKDYIEWLNSKPKSSVVYVSFGSIAVLPKKQLEAIMNGLLKSHRPFLWVIRRTENGTENEEENKILDRLEESKEKGLIVPWCSQMEVLSHASVGCFITHCGWNSTLESLVTGVPVIAFPQFSDQPTNAKLIEDVWKMGVRVMVNEEDGEGILETEELVRCLDMVMEGDSGKEMRKNAKQWRELARESAQEGGSSDRNLKAFVDGVANGSELLLKA